MLERRTSSGQFLYRVVHSGAAARVSPTHRGTSRNLKLPSRTERIHISSVVNVTSSACRSGSDYPQGSGNQFTVSLVSPLPEETGSLSWAKPKGHGARPRPYKNPDRGAELYLRRGRQPGWSR